MLRGPGHRPAWKTTTLAIAATLGLLASGAPATSASTGGAGISPTGKHAVVAPTSTRVAPPISPVHGLSQLSAGIALHRVGRRAASAASLVYLSQASGPLAVRVDVVRLADGFSVYNNQRTVSPGAPQWIHWSGRAPGGVALAGRYEFRIAIAGATQSVTNAVLPGGASAGGAAPQAAPPPPGSVAVGAFTFLGAIFPVRGAHSFGDAANAFGAGRAGHVHQGQDVLAKCGTPLVAAVGGIVRQRAVQSLAGNYVVIDDPLTKQSYLYAHLRAPALVVRGQHVTAGDPIGVVGETGDATTCHLHFELWTAPGWYTGGQPIDPLPTLKAWDRVS